MTVMERARAYIARKEISPTDLAQLIDVPDSTVRGWFGRVREPKGAGLQRLLFILDDDN